MKNYLRNLLYNLEIKKVFSSKLYLDIYPDVKEAGVIPIIHYIKYGKKEGRLKYLDISKKVKIGNMQYNLEKETIVFVSHESSASGAPLLGYSIIKELSEKYNIVNIVIKREKIHNIFYFNCDTILSDIQDDPKTYSYVFLKQLIQNRDIKCVVINSIVGYPIMYSAKKLDIPIVFLIHEFADYMRPLGTMIEATLHSDVVITPARIIENSIIKEFNKLKPNQKIPNNMYILPQGKLPFIESTYGDDDTVNNLYKKLDIDKNDDTKIIVGAGWVQIRKGVDLFVAISKYIKSHYKGKCKFVWVGEGFDPEKDLVYSVYLEREIEYSGLEKDFIFLEHQKNLDNIFSISDVFCLSSRMDPFPNVAIDALSHDLHIACFDNASGTAEFLRKYEANCTIANFVDTHQLAMGVVDYLNKNNKKIGVNKKIVENYLDFGTYVQNIDKYIERVGLKEK